MNNLGIQGQAAPEFRVPMWMKPGRFASARGQAC